MTASAPPTPAGAPRRAWRVPRGTILPPPRPGVRHVGIPFVGIVISDDDFRRRIDRIFHWPMIVLALAVIPLLVIELMLRAEERPAALAGFGFAVIWFAFVVEFVVKSTVAESRLEYARRNWLDLIIILVPILRPLRLTGSLARTTRVFKLRGVAMKCARYVFTIVLGMEATDRLMRRIGLRARRERKDTDAMTRFELATELRKLRKRSDAWERWYELHQEYIERTGGGCRS